MNLFDTISRMFLRYSFGVKERVKIYRLFAKTTDETRHGIKVIQVLEHVLSTDKKRNPKSMNAIMHRKWFEQLNQGKRFGTILKDYAPGIEAMIIFSCETSGMIALGFGLATEVAIMQQEFLGVLKKAMIGVVLNFVAALGLMTFFCKKIMPNLGGFILPRFRTPLTTFWLNVSAAYNQWFPILIVVIVVMITVVILLVQFYVGPGRKKLDKYPPFSVYRLLVGCSFLYSINSLSKAGVQHVKSLEIMKGFAAPYLRYRINRLLYFMNRGQSLGEAILSINLDFPDKEFIDQLQLYSSQGILDETLEQIILDMRNEGLEDVERQGAIMKYAGMIMNAALLAALAVGFFSMVFNMYSAT